MFEIELFKRQNPKKYPLSIITTISLIILIILSIFIKTYDKTKITGIVKDTKNCQIEVVLPYKSMPEFTDSIIEYKSQKYKIKNIEYKETIIENEILYERINFNLNIECKEKIIKAKILNNKQRIITKIFKIIKEE